MERVFLLINFRTLIVVALAVASTFLSIRYEFTASYSMTLFATAVVFPVVFAINGAYERRERVLGDYATVKSLMRSLYLASCHWPEQRDDASVARIKEHFRGWMDSFVTLVTAPLTDQQQNEAAVYRTFADLSAYIRSDLQDRGVGPTQVSRANNYLSDMMRAFESIKHVYEYRTPKTLRAFSDVFIMLLPPIYGPHFAQLAIDYNATSLAYVMPVALAVVLTALANIQAQLENPFDQYGEDDVKFGVDHFLSSLDVLGDSSIAAAKQAA